MAAKFSTSTNIIRDQGKTLSYLVTANSQRVADEIRDAFLKGIHSFTLIGSYGTGKSSFLLALERSLRGEKILDFDLGVKPKKVKSLHVIGQYQSVIQHFQDLLGVVEDFEGNQKVFDKLFEMSEGLELLVVYIDEFGKFLEYASKNNPDRELYFLQQLAEFVNDHNRKILLLTTLHQNFEAYSLGIPEASQRREWKKVKGRFKELTFNEPVEQLLLLAAEKLGGKKNSGQFSLAQLVRTYHLIDVKGIEADKVESKLWPLDLLSATVLTKALQTYGQNERSLFTFLETDLTSESRFAVSDVYDYLFRSFYSFLHSTHNVHYRHWQAMQSGTERIESMSDSAQNTLVVYKTIGLIQLFGGKGATINAESLTGYLQGIIEKEEVASALTFLEGRKLIVFAKYLGAYKLIEGTDVDFDFELSKAEDSIDKNFDVPAILREHFSFPVLQAKEVSYKKGTPRLFEFRISSEVQWKLTPMDATDGYINLLFNNDFDPEALVGKPLDSPNPLLIGYFTNSKQIEDRVFEILKTKKVLAANIEDLVAKQEFQKIIASHERLLSHEVMGSLYTEKVRWFFNGKEVHHVNSPRRLNQLLSEICTACYPDTPVFWNELLNKHKISASIHTARKNYFSHLANHWMLDDMGFDALRFPPEKTIYQSLLMVNGMHNMGQAGCELVRPNGANGFDKVWDACSDFLKDSRSEKKSISGLWDLLSTAPYKLKLGLIDFWVPTFLFINRGDFALYEEDRFIPELNDSVMYLMTRQPGKYYVKAFEINDLRLRVFNKYREVLNQGASHTISSADLIESLKPFLVFYKTLNSYSRNTKRLSDEAMALRSSISQAKDLEETFFRDIPKALRLDTDLTKSSDTLLSDFAVKLNDTIQEIKNAYSNLLVRFETYLTSEVLGESMDFLEYKKALALRYSKVKEHQLLPKQKVFIARLNSPLNDRDSWLASIGQALLGKPLDQISDLEEDQLYDRLARTVKELDNLSVLHKVKLKEGEEVIKLDITTAEGMQSQNIRIAKGKQAEVDRVTNELKAILSQHKGISLAVLSKLIQIELNDE